jgi:hypothetical protein
LPSQAVTLRSPELGWTQMRERERGGGKREREKETGEREREREERWSHCQEDDKRRNGKLSLLLIKDKTPNQLFDIQMKNLLTNGVI